MSAAKPQLATVTTEEFRARNVPQVDATPKKWYEAIQMAVQKSLTPSVSLSPANVGLALALFLQTTGIIIWASNTNSNVNALLKESGANKQEIIKLNERMTAELDVQRAYKEDVGRHLGEVKAILQTMQINEQTKKLLEQIIDEQLTAREKK